MTDLKIFTDVIEGQALDQIYSLAKQPCFSDAKIRIMPDVHAGKGCVIGFTADFGDKVVPNLVGVDIGCGMLTVCLGRVDIDFARLDEDIRKYVPSGRNVHETTVKEFPELKELMCYPALREIPWIERSLGTLGGGNHFIEIDIDDNGNKYLVIHTGSRNLGKQVADYYQQLAIDTLSGKKDFPRLQNELIEKLKREGRQQEISEALEELRKAFRPELGIPREMAYLTGAERDAYLHDMSICQHFARQNRQMIAEIILRRMGLKAVDSFETIHNYIEIESNMIRKGAVSAKAGERLLIPINMRDGCLVCVGKGNEDWNCSAPHGAGRLMSRSKAKEKISLEEYEKSMEGIFTTSVVSSTIDESPMAYKSIEDIVDRIADTVDIIDIIKPVYNFKASE